MSSNSLNILLDLESVDTVAQMLVKALVDYRATGDFINFELSSGSNTSSSIPPGSRTTIWRSTGKPRRFT
jgi:hypothetical protein